MTAAPVEVSVSSLRVDRAWWWFGQNVEMLMRTGKRGRWHLVGYEHTPLRTTIRFGNVEAFSFPNWFGYPRPLRWLCERIDVFEREYKRRQDARNNRPASQARA